MRAPAPDGGQRFAVPRQPATGTVAGGSVSTPRYGVTTGGTYTGHSAVVRPTPQFHNHIYYYPQYYYPYGYGSFGLGYFYYNPYAWYGYGVPLSTYSVYSNSYPVVYQSGEIRLRVTPRYAEVFVDGYFAGRVEDFDGYTQSLRLEEGPHTIEIVADGYETLVFNVRVTAGRKIDYRAELTPDR